MEDEMTAVKNLKQVLGKVDTSIEVIAELSGVKECVTWLQRNETPDLGFFDIQLSDDVSFEIFDRYRVTFPVVFVTAFDEYLLQAFEQNAIHYILKPITFTKIEQAIMKVKQLETHFSLSGIKKLIEAGNNQNKTRLLVRKGTGFFPIQMEDIAYVFTEHKICFVRTRSGETYMSDGSLSEIEQKLNSNRFFRVNRQYLVQIDAISKFLSNQGKLLLTLNPQPKNDVSVGKDNASAFRHWITNS